MVVHSNSIGSVGGLGSGVSVGKKYIFSRLSEQENQKLM